MSLSPAFSNHNVPIIFSSNDYFVPYMSVMIASIITHADDKNNYDILILHRDISDKSRQKLMNMLSKSKNFSIRFIDVTQHVQSHSFYTANRMFFTVEAYFRLLIPFLLDQYDKVIYMDGDMVALTDVAKLIQIDLGHLLIGAVRDFCGLADVHDPKSTRLAYMTEQLELENYNDYYISGLLIMNLRAFRQRFEAAQIMALAASRAWQFHDQDILNILTKNQTLLLDARWNVLQDYGKHRLMPAQYYNEWRQSTKKPFIIHFGGDAKPWRMPRVPQAKNFWLYARKSLFYPEICDRLHNELKENKLYRLKYYLQFVFPLGSRSRNIVKFLTKPIWRAVKIYMKQ